MFLNYKLLINISLPDQRLAEDEKDCRACLHRVLHPGKIFVSVDQVHDNCHITYLRVSFDQVYDKNNIYTILMKGDLEKAMGNKPVESMDRERACIPSLQVLMSEKIEDVK